MNKAVFLDRDGVINEEIGRYVFTMSEFKIVNGIIPFLKEMKRRGYHLIVVTNQAGIAKGMYGYENVDLLHDYFQKECGGIIDHFYYSPYHPDYDTQSLGRKPGTLLFEKAIAKYNLDATNCWMIGDKERDMIPAKELGMQTIRLFLKGFSSREEGSIADYDFDQVDQIDINLF